MDRNELIKELKNIKLIAHRLGYQMTNYPENSIEVLETIFSDNILLSACHGFEFDVCFTKDHVPVVIHDKYIDDITDYCGLIKDYTLEELRKINFKFRKSMKRGNNSISYKIVTLEEVLHFFEKHISLLGNKIIKIETKDYIFFERNNFDAENLKELANILNRFSTLSQNIVHLSFWPLNLLFLKVIQNRNNYKLTKNDLLCDYGVVVSLTKFMPFLDSISLRIRTRELAKVSENNPERVNKKIRFDTFLMNCAGAVSEGTLQYAIDRYGTVGLYTLNSIDEIGELCRHLNADFLDENVQRIFITTNNPIYLKSIDPSLVQENENYQKQLRLVPKEQKN